MSAAAVAGLAASLLEHRVVVHRPVGALGVLVLVVADLLVQLQEVLGPGVCMQGDLAEASGQGSLQTQQQTLICCHDGF